MTDPSIDICICTFRRPILADTLKSLAAMPRPAHRLRVIIADNDTEPSAASLIDAIRPDFPFPLIYLHAPAANISIARNACLDAVEADCVAFVDDDETVSEGWLAALLETLEISSADIVLGPVEAIYGPSDPSWMVKGDFHATMPVFVSNKILTGYTCNVLMRRSVHLSQLRFDLALGKSGGEDTDFFYRASDLGLKIAFAPDAIVREIVPATRASMSWLLKRRFRSGQTYGNRLKQNHASILSAIAVTVGKAAYCFTLSAIMLYSPIDWRRNLLRGTLHLGVIGGLFGIRQQAHYGLAGHPQKPGR